MWQPELAVPNRCRVEEAKGGRGEEQCLGRTMRWAVRHPGSTGQGRQPFVPALRPIPAGHAPLCSALSVRAPCSCYFILIENENVISLLTKMLAVAASATAPAMAAASVGSDVGFKRKTRAQCRKVCLKITKAATQPGAVLRLWKQLAENSTKNR